MKVLIVGGGGREHALAWKLAQSPQVDEVICAPGNAGTRNVGRNVDVAANDLDGLVELAVSEGVGLVVIGPEDPLCLGLADRIRERDIPVFGPGKSGARLEGSKVFAKELLERHKIPTAAWKRFDRAGAAKAYVESLGTWPQVVKADGLAAGKGVFICEDAKEARAVIDAVMEERSLGEAGSQVVVEEFLEGLEVSVHAIADGDTLLMFETVVDHKQVGEGDTGPNTGGMGVVSPARWLNRRLVKQIEQRILLYTLHALRLEGIEFRGTLFVGLMITENGPRVLEYNCRFGDPETQALMRRFKSDLFPYLLATAKGELGTLEPPDWDRRDLVGVVGATRGYPGAYEKGAVIRGIDQAEKIEDVVVFHAGTRVDADGRSRADGGRVLCVTALAGDVEVARENAYAAFDRIEWDGKFARRDIGVSRGPRPGLEERMGAQDP